MTKKLIREYSQKKLTERSKRARFINIIEVIALIIGVLITLEVSTFITIGSSLIAMSAYLTQDRDWKNLFLFH